jgi:hypothetical protein
MAVADFTQFEIFANLIETAAVLCITANFAAIFAVGHERAGSPSLRQPSGLAIKCGAAERSQDLLRTMRRHPCFAMRLDGVSAGNESQG